MKGKEVSKTLKLLVCGLIILLVIFMSLKSLAYKPIIVISSSMEPDIVRNSVVIIDTKLKYEELEVGDVINYTHPEHKGVIHKVFQKSKTVEGPMYLTSGINPKTNQVIDNWVVGSDMYEGKVIKVFNWLSPIITFLFGNLVHINPLHLGFGFLVITITLVSLIILIMKGVLKMREIVTDVYVKTEHKINRKKAKVQFKGVIGKVLVSTMVLTTMLGTVQPVNAQEIRESYNLASNITQNYELSVEHKVYEVRDTISKINDMKRQGLVSNEILKTLTTQLLDLEKAVQLSGNKSIEDVEKVVQEVEETVKGVKGAETVNTVVSIMKKSLKLSEKIEIPQAKSVQLTDISNHWGKANIERLISLKAISGYPDNTYKPDARISFSEFLKVAVSSVEKDIKPAPQGSHWASGIYQTAIEKGIIKSSEFAGTKERFDSTITREDMALILVRLNEISQGNGKVDTANTKGMIQDYNKIASNRTYFVEQAFQKNLLKGKGNGFDPKGYLTRAEAATAVINLLDYKPGTVIQAPKTGTEKAKEVFNQIPVYNQKTNHGLKFEGVGYTLDDVAVFAKSYLSVYLNYDGTDKVSMDKWEQEVLGYMTTGSIESVAKAKQIYIESKDKCKADIIIDASKIEIKNGNFIVHSAFYDNVSGKTFKAEVTIGGHNVNKSEIAVGYVSIKEVK